MLRFRTEPLSFSLDQHMHTSVQKWIGGGDHEAALFGHVILFTQDKMKKWNVSGHSVRSFPTFHRQVLDFIESSDPDLRKASRRKFEKGNYQGRYAQPGEYSDQGQFIPAGSSRSNKENVPPPKPPHSDSPDSRKQQESRASSQSREKERESSNSASNQAPDSSRNQGAEHKRENVLPNTKQKNDIVNASASLNARPPLAEIIGQRYSTFDCGKYQRKLGYKEKHVPVARGRYGGVYQDIVKGENGGYVITGPTGCGKSTVALLPLFAPGKRVMVVEPTQANAANIYHEFKNILPNLFISGAINSPVPSVKFVAPTLMRNPLPPLLVTTTEKVLEYFQYHGKLPKVDYYVLDEFHLPILTMVTLVELFRTFDLCPKYILVSATAVGFDVIPSLPSAVTPIYGSIPVGVIPKSIADSDLDPRRWSKRGDGTVGVVAPSVSVATRLAQTYRSWGLKTFLITRDTLVSDYMKAAVNYQPRSVYVLEPGVEAGVTLSLAVLISMGATTAIRYDGKVVIEDTQPLDEIAAIQRGGRGGRVVPTLYVTPAKVSGPAGVSGADYYRAQAVIKMVAAGADIKKMSISALTATFPRLATVTRELAVAALSSGTDPFVSIYKRNDVGEIFKECGGTGKGFKALTRKDLYLYHLPSTFFVAPIADFTDIHADPVSFVKRRYQLEAARAMVESIPGLVDKFGLSELVRMVIAKFSVYVQDLFDSLKKVFDQPAPTKFVLHNKADRPPEIADFLKSAPEVAELFEYMKTQPVGIKYERVPDTNASPPSCTHSFRLEKRMVHFAFSDKYMSGNSVDTAKVSADVTAALRGLLAVEVLINGAPDKCVDLLEYKDRVPLEHKWFSENL